MTVNIITLLTNNADLLLSAGLGALLALTGCWLLKRQPGKTRKHTGKEAAKKPAVKLKLYHYHTYRSARCTWIAHELGIVDYIEVIEYQPYKVSESDAQWYKENVHPHGTVPALVIDDKQVMYEGAAICLYLADLQGELLPEEGQEHDYYNWSVYAVSGMDTTIKTIYVEMEALKGETNMEVLKAATSKFQQFANALDKQLVDKDYICGNRITAADVIVGYTIFWANTLKGGVLLQNYPRVKEYLERLRKRPAFEKGMGTTRDWLLHDLTYPKPKDRLVFYS